MKAFKAYDIRGVYPVDFTAEDVYRIGYFLPGLLDAREILVGRDGRLTSDEIFESLSRGITDAGADVISIGQSTTPMVYFANAEYGYAASVQITASHNPKEYNGMKISRAQALPVGADSGLMELEELVETGEVIPASTDSAGTVRTRDVKEAYLTFLKKHIPEDLDLSLSIDCSNGMAALLIHDLLGATPNYLFDTIDGNFPNHDPNPLEEENTKALKKAVIANKSELGIIYDGDADRVMFVDENGRYIQPDIITAVIGEYFLKQGKGWIIQDVRTSRSTTEHLERHGAQVYTGKVGHSFAKMKMRELNALFGGELSGHYYFRDFHNCDSGLLASLIVIEVANDLKKQGTAFSSYIDSIISYAASGERNYVVSEKDAAMEALKNHFTQNYPVKNLLDIDGYRLDFENWWFNVRKSNTEPYLRVVLEAKDTQMLSHYLGEVEHILQQYIT